MQYTWESDSLRMWVPVTLVCSSYHREANHFELNYILKRSLILRMDANRQYLPSKL